MSTQWGLAVWREREEEKNGDLPLVLEMSRRHHIPVVPQLGPEHCLNTVDPQIGMEEIGVLVAKACLFFLTSLLSKIRTKATLTQSRLIG